MIGAANLEFVNNHTYDISESSSPLVGAETLNTATQRASGDKKRIFSIVIMHSTIATNLENLKLLAFMKQTDANGIERDLALATWNGRVVLIDDHMPTLEVPESSAGAGDGYTKYTTYILGDITRNINIDGTGDVHASAGQLVSQTVTQTTNIIL
jgi:hypothetical protein